MKRIPYIHSIAPHPTVLKRRWFRAPLIDGLDAKLADYQHAITTLPAFPALEETNVAKGKIEPSAWKQPGIPEFSLQKHQGTLYLIATQQTCGMDEGCINRMTLDETQPASVKEIIKKISLLALDNPFGILQAHRFHDGEARILQLAHSYLLPQILERKNTTNIFTLAFAGPLLGDYLVHRWTGDLLKNFGDPLTYRWARTEKIEEVL